MHRLRWPPWRSFGPRLIDDLDDSGFFFPLGMLLLLPIAALTLFVLPLLVFVAEAPFAVGRALRSDARRVEAVCWWPNEIRLEWETTSQHARAVAEQVTRQLEQGYEHVAPANATFLGFTDPPAGPD